MNSNYKFIIYSTEDTGVATITLNRPEVLNSLDTPLLKELLQAIDTALRDDCVRTILLTGSGRAFCAGADLGTINLDKTDEAGAERQQSTLDNMGEYLNPIVRKLAGADKAIVAAVNGVAAGGGMGLALAADIVVAAESASFIQVFIPQLGIIPDMGCTWILPQLIGRARTMGLTLLGGKISAAEAEEWGLIWKCFPDKSLADEARKISQQLALSSSAGIASLKKAVRVAEKNSYGEQLEIERTLQGERCGSNDFAEGVEAFLNKRKPLFNQ